MKESLPNNILSCFWEIGVVADIMLFPCRFKTILLKPVLFSWLTNQNEGAPPIFLMLDHLADPPPCLVNSTSYTVLPKPFPLTF